MMSKEGLNNPVMPDPLSPAELDIIRRVFGRVWPRSPQPEAPWETDPGVECSKLLYQAGLAGQVWYGGIRGEGTHELVLALTDLSRENRDKVSGIEVDLQRRFPSYVFNLWYKSPLSSKDEAGLRENGYKLVPPPAETAPPNPL